MSEKLLSIIIPIYNVGPYLSRCIDSILLAPGIGSEEIILVDDGSTDGSAVVADSYAERYDFISCYHKENGGLSDARNYGLERAEGRYVFFCDSDDTVIPESLGRIIKRMAETDADVLLWDGISIDENDEPSDFGMDVILTHKGLCRGKMITGTEAMVRQIKDHNRIAMTAWLRACRTDFLKDKNLVFMMGLLHEDELWTPEVMLNAEKVMYFEEKVYCYRMRKGSIMANAASGQKQHAGDLMYILDKLREHYFDQISDGEQLRIILGNWADTYLWMISAYDVCKYDCAVNIPKKDIFKHAVRFKAKIKGLFLLLFGANAYCRLF